MSQFDELIQLFKEERGFNRLFSSFLDKFLSYGKLGKNVTVKIEKPTEEEKKAIGGLLGKDFSKSKVITVKVLDFEKSIYRTKYKDFLNEFNTVDILEKYLGQSLLSKKEQEKILIRERKSFFNQFLTDEYPGLIKEIIYWSMREGNTQNRFYLLYKQNVDYLKKQIDILSKLFCCFPMKQPVYLPILSSQLTKDPHALDLDTELGRLLVYSLQVIEWLKEDEEIKSNLSAEEITDLFLSFNILRDDLSNDVTVFNVRGFNGNGKENMLLYGASQEQASFKIPLREVIKLKKLKAVNDKIVMIENSGVSSYIISKIIENNQHVSMITGNGILNLATIRFLDLFIKSGGKIYYSGDFDPEGLNIAQNLKNRYGENVDLWFYKRVYYRESISDKTVNFHKMNKIVDSDLENVKEEMKVLKRTGYEENILDELVERILKLT